MSTEVATPVKIKTELDLARDQSSLSNVFGSIQAFEQAQRIGTMLSNSALVPENYRGSANMPNCVIALEMANRIGMNVISIMQNMYIVHGKPAWSSQFLISCVNASGNFSPLRYEAVGTQGKDDWGRRAWAVDKTGEKLVGPLVTIAMAKSEGWMEKNGSKWKTMPELMLCYRAATFFTRLYSPELTMGMMTDDEVLDTTPAKGTTPRPIGPAVASALPPVTPPAPPAAPTAPPSAAGPATATQPPAGAKPSPAERAKAAAEAKAAQKVAQATEAPPAEAPESPEPRHDPDLDPTPETKPPSVDAAKQAELAAQIRESCSGLPIRLAKCCRLVGVDPKQLESAPVDALERVQAKIAAEEARAGQ